MTNKICGNPIELRFFVIPCIIMLLWIQLYTLSETGFLLWIYFGGMLALLLQGIKCCLSFKIFTLIFFIYKLNVNLTFVNRIRLKCLIFLSCKYITIIRVKSCFHNCRNKEGEVVYHAIANEETAHIHSLVSKQKSTKKKKKLQVFVSNVF